MKKTEKENFNKKSRAAFEDSPEYLKKKILELEKEITKLQNECVKKDVKLVSQRERILALETVIPKAIRPKTVEDTLRELAEKRAK